MRKIQKKRIDPPKVMSFYFTGKLYNLRSKTLHTLMAGKTNLMESSIHVSNQDDIGNR